MNTKAGSSSMSSAKFPEKSEAKQSGEKSSKSGTDEAGKQTSVKQSKKAQSPSALSPARAFFKSLLTRSPRKEDKDLGKEDKDLGKEDKSLGKKDNSLGKEDKSLGKEDRSLGKEDKSLGKEDSSLGKEDKSLGKEDKSLGKQDKILGKEDKPKMLKPKKTSKAKSKKGGKKQDTMKTKQVVVEEKSGVIKESVSKGVEDSRTMVQTSLSNTTEGIEVISSPEQPQAKVQRKKSGKKSRVPHSSERQSKGEQSKQTKISDLFLSRKSSRICKSEQKKDELVRITEAILSKNDEGLEVRDIEGKGRGVFANRPFSKNQFVCEYAGELISYDEAKKREEAYSNNEDIGCYMYYIQFNNKKYCIDATEENGTLGRLLNHSRTGGNCKTRLHAMKGKPHLILVTTRDIEKDEELTYDYGDRSKTAIDSHPWLKY